jgi:hypothetical protein
MFAEKLATMGLTGAGLGALAGLATSDKGNRNKAVGRGAVIGAGTELGGLAGTVPGALIGGLGGYMLNGAQGAGLGALAGGGLGAAGGAALGNMAGRGVVGPYKRDPVPSKPKPKEKQAPEKKDDDEKEARARKFGEKLAMDPRLMGGLGGAALGAGVGGLAGLVNPGVDESGKRKSRLGAALKGALGGGAVGGLGGAAVGHFAPNQTQQFGSQLAGLLGGGKAGPSQAEQDHNRQMKALNRGFMRGWPSSETDQPRHELVKAVGEEPRVGLDEGYLGVSRRPGTDMAVSQSIPGADRQIAATLANEERMRAAEGRPSLQQEMQMLREQSARQKQLQGAYGAEPMGPQ